MSANALATSAWNASASLSNFVAPPRKTGSWVGTESDITGSEPARPRRITNIEGIDLNLGKEFEEIELLGRSTVDKISVRENASVVITRKADSEDYGFTFHDADRGVQNGNLFNSSDQLATDSGYRVFVKLSDGTGSGHTWVTLRNCLMAEWMQKPAPNKVIVETMRFESNLFDVRRAPTNATTLDTEL